MANKKNGTGITKQDAVRRALAALGHQASAKDIQKHVKETFGHDMTIDHIYNAKSTVMAKARTKRQKPAAPKPAPEKPAAAPLARNATGAISLEDVQAAKALLERVGAGQLHQLIDLLAR
jgi:hypothetical protein